MKKLFTIIAVCGATLAMYTASAGTTFETGKVLSSQKANAHTTNVTSYITTSSVTTCDTLFNLNFATADSNEVYFAWDTPSTGYISGNAAIAAQAGTFISTTAIAEEFNLPSSGYNVNGAIALFAYWRINPTAADSAMLLKAYVYDTTGTGAFGGIAPGNALDSTTVTFGSIVSTGEAQLTFPHQPLISGRSFFVAFSLPQMSGDTLVLATNDGSTGHGNGWLEAAGGWVSYDSVTGGGLVAGNYIFSEACKTTTNTGIENINGVSSFNVFPNPSNGVFTAALNLDNASDVTITVTDVTGSKIYESNESAVKQLTKQINLSSAAAGLYFVSVKTATGTVNQRIVIK
jgi:hypothetical protein